MDEKSSDIKKTNRKIKNAMWAGIVSAAISVIFALTGSYGYDLWVLPDVAAILGLTLLCSGLLAFFSCRKAWHLWNLSIHFILS